MEYKKITYFFNFLLNQMKLFLLIAISFLGWQFFTVTNTLANRLQERANQIDYVITEYLENN